jgi:subtilase family serine protease
VPGGRRSGSTRASYGGGFYGVIGTSVSSPEFVGALAIFEQQFGKYHRLGNVNYFLYLQGALQTLAGGVNAPSFLQFYHRNIPGFDGYYSAGKPSYNRQTKLQPANQATTGKPSYNYDYIYGLGSLDVRKLFGLEEFPAASLPQTRSNP